MTYKGRAFVLLAFVLVASSIITSTASATEKSFHQAATSGKAKVDATQTSTEVFTTSAGNLMCKSATSQGTLEAATSMELTLAPSFAGCTAFGFINFGLDINGCQFLYTSATTTNGANEPDPVTHITCPAGKAIEITVPGCLFKIGPQTLLGVTITTGTGGAKKDILLTKNISGIDYDECGTTRTNGTWKGATTATAADASSGSAANLWYE